MSKIKGFFIFFSKILNFVYALQSSLFGGFIWLFYDQDYDKKREAKASP